MRICGNPACGAPIAPTNPAPIDLCYVCAWLYQIEHHDQHYAAVQKLWEEDQRKKRSMIAGDDATSV